MEGRDIGTCVFPNANVKIYLDASPEERAKRRFKQNQEKGIDMSYNEIIENIKKSKIIKFLCCFWLKFANNIFTYGVNKYKPKYAVKNQ